VSRRYVAALAAVAVTILAIGLLVRSQLYSTPVDTSPPSEATTLRQLSQEAQLRRSAAFIAEQVMAVAPSAEYVSVTGTSGVWWTRDTLLSSMPARPLVAVAREAIPVVPAQRGDTVRRAVTFAGDSTRRGWVVVVGRDAGGDVISAQFLAGGLTTATCAGAGLERYVLGAPLDERFAGAGVFGVDGALLGLAVWCDDEVVAVPAFEVRRLLATPPDQALESALGFRVAPPGPLVRTLVESDSAALVSFVRSGSAASDAGLRTGDVLVTIGGRPATLVTVRASIGPGLFPDSLVVARRQAGRTETVVVRRSAASRNNERLGVELASSSSPRGVPIARVRAGSPAARAGLLAGDRLVSIGSTVVTSAATAQPLLASAAGDARPTLVVVDREGGEHALLVAASPLSAGATDSVSADR
jgi:membrane-associated protease RseP (regulator of RpoE activity)